jgi:hypothetical protein
MVIGSESVNHGVQFFDMKKLLTLDPAKPKNFSTATDLAGWFNDLPAGRSHNVVVVSHNYRRCWMLNSTLSLASLLIKYTAFADMSTCRGLLLPTYAGHLANVISLSRTKSLATPLPSARSLATPLAQLA